ncbi:MAG: hypothetical protein NTW25_04355 [Candidatus Kapabacteria bacterium]|nr:hypothetical protein [Candidatus Kapabacteria bacterium]
MEQFKVAIILLVKVALAFTAIQVYLQINKMWKRKHEREVADSQSISGLTIQILSCILSICYYIFDAYINRTLGKKSRKIKILAIS